LQYHFRKLTFEFGPGFGLLVHEFEACYDQAVKSDLTLKNPFAPRELSINIGGSYALNGKWVISARYTNSLLSLRRNTSSVKKHDRIGTLNCVLAFSLV